MSRDFLKERGIIKRAYLLILFGMGLTGFAQMPIFKRYYIADIPGLGWLADFYFTHFLHYLGAALFLALSFYCVTAYLLEGRRRFSLSSSAYVRIALLLAIGVTGVFRVLKNLPDVLFSPGFTLFIDISHLAFMMLLMLAALFFRVVKSGWIASEI